MKRVSILLIEDNVSKQVEIIEYLDRKYNHVFIIDTAKNVKEALNSMKLKSYDVYIIDLNIPESEYASPKNNGSEVIINIIKENKDEEKVICISKFKDAIEENNELVKSFKFIDYSYGNNKEWENTLSEYIDDILKESINRKYDIAIITALDEELETVLKASGTVWEIMTIEGDDTFYKTTKIRNSSNEIISIVAATAIKMGMPHSSSLATKMIMKFNPNYIVMLGICAGNKDETDLGNIVVADSSFNYQAGKIVDNEFFADGGELQLDGYLQNLITTTKDNFSHDISKECDPKGDYTFPKLVIGQMISGSAVIKQENFFNTLKHKSRKITALDMEAYSVFVAANMTNCNKTKALVIKGVQDFADLQKNDKYRQHALLVCAKYFYKLCDYKLISKIKADS